MANQQAVESLESIGDFYYKTTLRPPTPLSIAFFSPSNILCIKQAIEERLLQLTGECIRIVITDEVAQTLTDVVERNLAYSYVPEQGLQLLNDLAIEHEVSVQYMSLRHRKQFYRRIMSGERLRVFPYGTMTKITKGDVKISPSSYQLGLPWKRRQNEYLQEVLCVGQYSDHCTRPFPHPVRT